MPQLRGVDISTNLVSKAVQVAWSDEAESLGLSGSFAGSFVHISGCATCRAARNAVRAERERQEKINKANRDAELYMLDYSGKDARCGDALCFICYGQPSFSLLEPFRFSDYGPATNNAGTQSAEPLRATDFDDLVTLSTVYLNLQHAEQEVPAFALGQIQIALNNVTTRIAANS